MGDAIKALQKIAHGRKPGRRPPRTREEIITIAREACDRIGVPYSERAIVELERPRDVNQHRRTG